LRAGRRRSGGETRGGQGESHDFQKKNGRLTGTKKNFGPPPRFPFMRTSSRGGENGKLTKATSLERTKRGAVVGFWGGPTKERTPLQGEEGWVATEFDRGRQGFVENKGWEPHGGRTRNKIIFLKLKTKENARFKPFR